MFPSVSAKPLDKWSFLLSSASILPTSPKIESSSDQLPQNVVVTLEQRLTALRSKFQRDLQSLGNKVQSKGPSPPTKTKEAKRPQKRTGLSVKDHLFLGGHSIMEMDEEYNPVQYEILMHNLIRDKIAQLRVDPELRANFTKVVDGWDEERKEEHRQRVQASLHSPRPPILCVWQHRPQSRVKALNDRQCVLMTHAQEVQTARERHWHERSVEGKKILEQQERSRELAAERRDAMRANPMNNLAERAARWVILLTGARVARSYIMHYEVTRAERIATSNNVMVWLMARRWRAVARRRTMMRTSKMMLPSVSKARLQRAIGTILPFLRRYALCHRALKNVKRLLLAVRTLQKMRRKKQHAAMRVSGERKVASGGSHHSTKAHTEASFLTE